MRNWFTQLLALGILLGLQINLLAVDPCELIMEIHTQMHMDHGHDTSEPCDPAHEQDCPLNAIHHGGCAHTQPLATEPQSSSVPANHLVSLSLIRPDSKRAPAAPVLELDKPPLI